MLRLESLTALDAYRLRVANKPEIVEDEIAPGVVCFSVMKGVGTADTYSDRYACEARGICFSTITGNVISRPYHKFFNMNEREATMAHNLEWGDVVRIMDKRDGSMIHPVLVNGAVRMKSKKTLESTVAVNAQKFLSDKVHTFCYLLMTVHNATPIFEWTSPKDRIVLGYEHPELKLCHVRENVSGDYWSLAKIRQFAEQFKVPMVDEVTRFKTFQEMLDAAETEEGIEGWVIQFADGEMVKVKTKWYMARHRAMTNYRERDVVEDIMDEKIDDVKSMLVADGIDIAPILEIEKRYSKDMMEIINNTEAYYNAHKDMPAAQVAARFKEHPYFGLVMAMYNKKQPKFEDFFRRNYWKQKYTLDSIAVLMGRAADEGEEE